MRSTLATLLTLAAVLLAGCGRAATTPRPSPPTTTNPATTSTASPGAPPSSSTTTAPAAARQTAAVFAAAYARYLDGLLDAAALPDASAQVHSQAGQLMPAAARRGPLTVKSVTARGGGSTFTATLADRAHSFEVQLTVLAAAGGGEQVVGVVPPDFDSLLAPAPRPIPQPSGSAPAQHVAREFLAGYLAWLYGHARVSAIHDATRLLLAQLSANPPNVPPAFQSRYAHPVAVGLTAAADGGWTAYASVTDGQQTYELTLTIMRDHGGWLVSNVNSPQ